MFLVYLVGLREAGPEGKNRSNRNHNLHINTRLAVRHGRVLAHVSGHGRPQGADPLAPVPMDPRSPPHVQLCPEVSLLWLGRWASWTCVPTTSMSHWASTLSQLRTRSDTHARGSTTWSSDSCSYRRSGGLTTIGLGLIPTNNSELEASLGEEPIRGNLYQTLSLPLS